MTYEELVSIMQTVVKYDMNKYVSDLQSISIVPGTTCHTFIRNDDDVLFMLGEDTVIHRVCISLIERAAGDVIAKDISALADHGHIVGLQLDEDFGYQIEMNDGQYNHQYNEMYNDMNNKQNNEPNVRPIHEVAIKVNLYPVDNVANNEEDEEPFQKERHARRVHRCSSTLVYIAGTFEVRPNVTLADSENATTWVIPGAKSYSFGMGGSRNFVEDEPTSMIYKGSNKKTLHLVCLMDNWTWKLRAVRRDEATYFEVKSFVNKHTCPLEEIHRRHRQASAIIIREVVAPRLQQQDGRLIRLKDIIVDMKIMYGIQIMCSKAHQALQYALSLAYGTYEETFQLLSSFGYVLEQQNPRTITDLQSDKDGVLSHIDVLVFISDRHASIEVEISKVFPYATHTICVRHFYENIKKRYHKKDVTAIMDKAARAYTELQYNWHMEELRNLHPNVYDYVIDTGPHKWSYVHYHGRRYRVMTTDAAECINSCLKFTRKLSMLTLAEVIRNMLQR
ncbi:hypothetical protein Ddye_025760 [Dipteronia dyeriana]|uniref:MULE transposase domain-containing protein n=1 Tax=Dipteronia dyeriana TaxID=168575 RepID=A0AAD9WPW8_9ROSI|nr:hypothetical protein Ddye_025760 [Dipteronia dyeriana]